MLSLGSIQDADWRRKGYNFRRKIGRLGERRATSLNPALRKAEASPV
jgi:hypothetical protein